jgi:protein-disulfide isomerase
VRIALYEDFHCPHCADFEAEFGPMLNAAHTDGTATVELYPMAFIDEGSFRAANAMACAAERGFGPAYYSALFANHTLSWSDQQLLDLANLVAGPVSAPFTACVRDAAHTSWVSSINAAAEASGVTGTPTMFIDGQPVDIAGLTPGRLAELLDQAARQ